MLWRFLERVLAQIVAFVVSVVLARILEPEAYGTVALISVFTLLFQVFVDSGLGNALIQKKDADEIDFSTVFYTNIVFCTVLYVLIFLLAPLIAEFYDDITLTPYIRVLGITILISGIKNVQQAFVSRNMLFRKFFFSTLGGTVTAGVVGVIMAVNGFGVWALIAQQIVNLSIDTVLLWIIVKWRPVRRFSFNRLKGLFSFGWKLLVSSLIDTGFRELTNLIIGKKYTSDDLAYYNQGQKIPNLVVYNLNTSIDSVLLPAMSNVQDDKEHVKNMTRRSIMVSTYILAPLMIGIVAVGETLVQLLLTEKWLFSVPFMRVFCITYLFYPIHTANLNAIKALGRSDLFLVLEVIKKIVGLIAILSTMWISVTAMAYSLLFTSVAYQIINSWPNRKLLNYYYHEQILDILPNIMLSAFMGVCVYCVGLLLGCSLWVLFLQILLGVFIYVAVSWLFKFQSFIYVLSIIKSFRKKVEN